MPHIPTKSPIDKMEAFRALCEARCIRFGAGDLTLHQTVDWLQHLAVRNGVVRAIGQDAVQKIIAHALAPYRTDLDPPPVD